MKVKRRNIFCMGILIQPFELTARKLSRKHRHELIISVFSIGGVVRSTVSTIDFIIFIFFSYSVNAYSGSKFNSKVTVNLLTDQKLFPPNQYSKQIIFHCSRLF